MMQGMGRDLLSDGVQVRLLGISFVSSVAASAGRAHYPELGRVGGSACDKDSGARHTG